MELPPQPPFLVVEDVKAHLTLMAAFQIIHQKVEKFGIRLDTATGLPMPTSNALLFLARSLQRFELWIATLDQYATEPGLRDHEIPPLDVLMFLHAYMLSPLDFYEDSISKHKVLKRIEEFPLIRTVHLIDKATLELTPTSAQVEHWTRATSFPFDIPFDSPASETFVATCPRCENGVTIPWADVTVPNEITSPQDYATPVFQATCTKCQLSVSPNTLCAGRFLRDIYDSRVTDTLLDHTGAFPDLAAAQVASLQIADKLGLDLKLTPQMAGNQYGWDVGRVTQRLSSQLDPNSDSHRKFANVVHGYSHPGDFAVDLSKAVLRQARFIFQMSAMGWLELSLFDEKDNILLQAIRHYEQFICIEAIGMIARWDIDLIWHTHQLSGAKYRADTLRILGRILDHDDTQSQDVIVSAAEHADAVWKEKFGESYLIPSYDPDLVSSLAETLCGGSSGGACVKGDPTKGGGSGEGGTKRSTDSAEFKNLAVLAY